MNPHERMVYLRAILIEIHGEHRVRIAWLRSTWETHFHVNRPSVPLCMSVIWLLLPAKMTARLIDPSPNSIDTTNISQIANAPNTNTHRINLTRAHAPSPDLTQHQQQCSQQQQPNTKTLLRTNSLLNTKKLATFLFYWLSQNQLSKIQNNRTELLSKRKCGT